MLILYQSLLPLLVVLVTRNELLPKLIELPIHGAHDDAAKDPHSTSDPPSQASAYRVLAVATVSAGAVLAIYSVPSTTALGISSAIFAATGLVLLEAAIKSVEDDSMTGAYAPVSANGVRPRRSSMSGPSREQQLVALRDFAAALTTVCGLASILVEPSMSNATSWEPTLHTFRLLQRILWMVPVSVLVNILMFIIVSHLICTTLCALKLVYITI